MATPNLQDEATTLVLQQAGLHCGVIPPVFELIGRAGRGPAIRVWIISAAGVKIPLAVVVATPDACDGNLAGLATPEARTALFSTSLQNALPQVVPLTVQRSNRCVTFPVWRGTSGRCLRPMT